MIKQEPPGAISVIPRSSESLGYSFDHLALEEGTDILADAQVSYPRPNVIRAVIPTWRQDVFPMGAHVYVKAQRYLGLDQILAVTRVQVDLDYSGKAPVFKQVITLEGECGERSQ